MGCLLQWGHALASSTKIIKSGANQDAAPALPVHHVQGVGLGLVGLSLGHVQDLLIPGHGQDQDQIHLTVLIVDVKEGSSNNAEYTYFLKPCL